MNKDNIITKNKKDTYFAITFTAIYAIITLVIALHHENWRDENQVWLLCKNLSYFDLLKQLKWEGHPFLWFTIIYPFVKFGASIKIVNIISWLFMTISVFLILKFSPFHKITKITSLVAFPVLYQFVIVGRSYSLAFLLVIIVCCLEKYKRNHPIIYPIILGLLINTHLFMVGFVGVITLFHYIYEIVINRKNNNKEENKYLVIGLGIIIFSLLLFVIQLFGSISSTTSNSITITQLYKRTIYFISNLPYYLVQTTDDIISVIVFLCVILLYVYAVMCTKKEIFIWILTVFLNSFIFAYIQYSSTHIFYLYYPILLYSLWCSMRTKNTSKLQQKMKMLPELCIVIISILSFSRGIKAAYSDYYFNYSSAYDMGTYIKENIETDATIITTKDAHCSSIIPYVNNKFYNANTDEFYTYITWDERRKQDHSNEEILNKITSRFDGNEKLYYIRCLGQNDEFISYLEQMENVSQLFQTVSCMCDEKYVIYMINLNN